MAGLLDDLHKRDVWGKGLLLPGREHERNEWRMDYRLKMIRYSDHGDRKSPWGWEIDHIVPSALGGSDDISNLRPLNCTDNARHGGLLGALLDV